jgi:hypothetical protein
MVRCLLVLVMLGLLGAAPARGDIPAALDHVFALVESRYTEYRATDFQAFCQAHGVAPDNAQNRRQFLRLHFLHDLMKGSGASNGARGGWLNIPYFWHWTNPNPRHGIHSLPDSTLLTQQRPAAPYRRYATRADIDRVPALYLGDLMTATPGYFHPRYGSFHTFGWCSEREMAYTALVTCWGFRAKVWQSGIHTSSRVLCRFQGTGGTALILEAEVDNTFAYIVWKTMAANTREDQWQADVGAGATIAWYNRKALSPEQHQALREHEVTLESTARIVGETMRGLGAAP